MDVCVGRACLGYRGGACVVLHFHGNCCDPIYF